MERERDMDRYTERNSDIETEGETDERDRQRQQLPDM